MSAPFGIRRVLGRTLDGKHAVYEPDNTSSSLILGGIGSGKTTCAIVPAIQAMIADHNRGIVINDPKNAEIAAQIGDMAIKMGRRFGMNDPFGVLGEDNPYRIRVNEFSGLVSAYERKDANLPFLIKGVTHTLVPEPPSDQRNFYWREEQRMRQRLALLELLKHNTALCTLGGLTSLLSDTTTFDVITDIAAEEAENTPHRALAIRIRNMRERNPEHHLQHMGGAVSVLDLFEEGPLHEAGYGADVTHEELLGDNWVVCFVTPARFIEQIGAYAAVQFNTLLGLQLTGEFGRTDYIVDEAPSGPFHAFFRDLNTVRGAGGRILLAGQSRAAFIKRYGEQVFAQAEENCRVKQYLQTATTAEADRLVKAAGEQKTVSASMATNSEKADYSSTISIGKEHSLTSDEVLSLSADEQLLQLPGLGIYRCLKVRQNQIAPTCYELSANPVEGGVLEPDPKVWLPTGPEDKT